MNAEKIYCQLIERSQNQIRNKANAYFEQHHILPKCLGGSDCVDNLVLLTAREHFIAHILLTKIHPHNAKIAYALHMMSVRSDTVGERNKINSRLYSQAKNALSKFVTLNGDLKKHHDVDLSAFIWLTKDGLNKKIHQDSMLVSKLLQSGWTRGRAKFLRKSPTQETRDKISNTVKGRPSNNKGKQLSTNGKSYEEIYGVEKAKELKQLRSIKGKNKPKSKYIWKLVAPDKETYYVENVNVVDFFKEKGVDIKKSVIIVLVQSNQRNKPIHHGKIKDWQATQITKTHDEYQSFYSNRWLQMRPCETVS